MLRSRTIYGIILFVFATSAKENAEEKSGNEKKEKMSVAQWHIGTYRRKQTYVRISNRETKACTHNQTMLLMMLTMMMTFSNINNDNDINQNRNIYTKIILDTYINNISA